MRIQNINSYLKMILIAGIPILFFMMIFFSFLMGFREGLIAGLLIGLCVGSIVSIVLGFFYNQPSKEVMSSLLNEITLHRGKRKKTFLTFLPYFIIFFGAVYTRYSEKILLSFVLTIILSVSVAALISFLLGEFKRSLQEGELITHITSIVTLLIPFTFIYFLSLFILVGFNFEWFKKLF